MGKITDLNGTAFSVKDTLEYFAFATKELLKKDYDKHGYETITRCLENYEKTRGKAWESRNKNIVGDRMKKDKLKPCPFCGGEEVRITHHGGFGVNCLCGGMFYDSDDTAEEARKGWNKRSNRMKKRFYG